MLHISGHIHNVLGQKEKNNANVAYLISLVDCRAGYWCLESGQPHVNSECLNPIPDSKKLWFNVEINPNDYISTLNHQFLLSGIGIDPMGAREFKVWMIINLLCQTVLTIHQ